MLTREEFQQKVENGVHILDGATGSNLRAKGLPNGYSTELWVFEHPEILQDLQRQADLARMHAELLKQREQLEKQIAWDLLAARSPEFAKLLQNYRDAGGQL